MATPKTKTFYYVLVFTDDGPKYVTGTGEHHTAYWDDTKKPYVMSKERAEDMTTGLLWNGFSACVVVSKLELTCQPYNYKEWQIKWEEVNNNEESEKDN